MARPKDQVARRREIVVAARRAVVERGIRGLRVKDVASEAGISAGLVSYYYPDLEDLLVEVHEDSVDRFYWARMRLVESAGPARERLRALVIGGLPDGPEDELCHALYELHMHATRHRAHAALMTALFDREVSVYAMVLEHGARGGELTLAAPAIDIATNAVALEDAYGLHIIARNKRVDADRARNLVLAYLSQVTSVALSSVAEAAAPTLEQTGQAERS